MKHEVFFHPSGKRGQVEERKTILEAARELGISLRSDCGGKGTCGKCRIMVEDGEGGLSSPTEKERRLLGSQLDSRCRLACSAAIHGPLSVTVPSESLADEPVILAEGEGVPFELSPVIRKYHIDMTVPNAEDSAGDAQRLLNELAKVYHLKALEIDYPMLRKLPGLLRDAAWDVTVTVWDGRQVVDVEPGYVDDGYGMAVDIGTTTVVGYLMSMRTGRMIAVESMTNPQVAYGADVMTRIVYAMKDDENRRRIRQSIVEGLNTIVERACAKAGIAPSKVLEMTLVGNTAMHHIFLGLNTESLARAPFVPVLQEACDFKARDLLLVINPCANVHVLPIEAGFVGADNVGVLIATQPQQYPGLTLVIDIGTNGEIVLGSKEAGLMCCSAAAGPAFEG
ncbi:MAG TPA: ASKHA domain-containing protein, partial [Dehalococcoidia bacterium]|nr:ASKHA domain-containing protein [Dehalococcoidia bacterium]